MVDLSGRTCLITGAGNGIGRAVALAFAARGCRLVLCDIDQCALEEIRGRCPNQCVVVDAVDVADREAVACFAEKVHATVGPMYVLVNNAGVYLSGSALELTLADWDWVLGVNLWGAIHACHHFLRPMLEQGTGGHVVNVASMYGFWPSPGVAGYLTSKFGVFGFSEALREDLRVHGIRVSTICPGMVRTGLIAKMRIRNGGDPEVVRRRLARMYERRDYEPGHVANVIVSAVLGKRNRIELVSGEAQLIYRLERYFPTLSRYIARRAARRMFGNPQSDTD